MTSATRAAARPSGIDWERLRPPRKRPLVMVLTRYLSNFRRPVFERLARHDDFDWVFLHSDEVPDWDTGVTAPPLATSHIVAMRGCTLRRTQFPLQPESIRLVHEYNPEVILCESSWNLLTVHACAIMQRWRGQGVIHYNKGSSPKSSRFGVLSYLRRLLTLLTLMPTTVIVTYGRSQVEFYRELGTDLTRVVPSQNTVDTDELLRDTAAWLARGRALRQRLGIDDRTVIAVTSRLIPTKRIDLLIRAAAALHEADRRIAVVVGGSGPEFEALRKLAAQFPGLPVHMLGRLPVGEDNVVLAAGDINVFPGAVGLAIVQSMSLRKPTVCADEPGADAELIVHEQTGLRFPRGDADGLRVQIERLIRDPALATHLGECGRQHVVENATIDRLVERLLEAVRLALRTRAAADGIDV